MSALFLPVESQFSARLRFNTAVEHVLRYLNGFECSPLDQGRTHFQGLALIRAWTGAFQSASTQLVGWLTATGHPNPSAEHRGVWRLHSAMPVTRTSPARITGLDGALRINVHLDYLSVMRSRKRRPARSAAVMMTELAWASWVTITRRTLMVAQSTCTPAEYHRMVREKAAAALETSRLLSSPKGASAAALLKPWHSRATGNAKRLRRR